METKSDSLIPYKKDDLEVVNLRVRNNENGDGILFTSDGKLVGHQVAHMGHYYYVGHGKDRVKMFRASFVVGDMKADLP